MESTIIKLNGLGLTTLNIRWIKHTDKWRVDVMIQGFSHHVSYSDSLDEATEELRRYLKTAYDIKKYGMEDIAKNF